MRQEGSKPNVSLSDSTLVRLHLVLCRLEFRLLGRMAESIDGISAKIGTYFIDVKEGPKDMLLMCFGPLHWRSWI